MGTGGVTAMRRGGLGQPHMSRGGARRHHRGRIQAWHLRTRVTGASASPGTTGDPPDWTEVAMGESGDTEVELCPMFRVGM